MVKPANKAVHYMKGALKKKKFLVMASSEKLKHFITTNLIIAEKEH